MNLYHTRCLSYLILRRKWLRIISDRVVHSAKLTVCNNNNFLGLVPEDGKQPLLGRDRHENIPSLPALETLLVSAI